MLMTNTQIERLSADRALISHLGGPTKVAKLLGYDKLGGGVQRVQNWMHRGIPSAVKVDHPDLFLAGFPSAKTVEEQGAVNA